MATRIKISTKGMEPFLEEIAALGLDVDESAKRALLAGAAVAVRGMRRRVRKDTHNLEKHINVSPPRQDGNYVYVEVGVMEEDGNNADEKTALYANVNEYGSSSMAAQPYIRPTMVEDKAAIQRAEREELKGVLGE